MGWPFRSRKEKEERARVAALEARGRDSRYGGGGSHYREQSAPGGRAPGGRGPAAYSGGRAPQYRRNSSYEVHNHPAAAQHGQLPPRHPNGSPASAANRNASGNMNIGMNGGGMTLDTGDGTAINMNNDGVSLSRPDGSKISMNTGGGLCLTSTDGSTISLNTGGGNGGGQSGKNSNDHRGNDNQDSRGGYPDDRYGSVYGAGGYGYGGGYAPPPCCASAGSYGSCACSSHPQNACDGCYSAPAPPMGGAVYSAPQPYHQVPSMPMAQPIPLQQPIVIPSLARAAQSPMVCSVPVVIPILR